MGKGVARRMGTHDDDVTDEALLRRIAQGDENALRMLYDAYRPRLRRYLLRQMAGDAAAADEAMQEAFLGVWQAAPGFRGEARVMTWLFQIAHYSAIHVRRRLERQSLPPAQRYPQQRTPANPYDSDSDAPGYEPSHSSPENAVLDRLALMDALRRRSPKHRVVLDLVLLQGFSLEEASSILAIPLGTVKSRLSNARRALIADLTEYERIAHHD